MKKMNGKKFKWKISLFFILTIAIVCGMMIRQYQENEVSAAVANVYITDTTTSTTPLAEIVMIGSKQTVVVKSDQPITDDVSVTWSVPKNDEKPVIAISGDDTTVDGKVKREITALRPGIVKLTAIVSYGSNVYTANVNVVVKPTIYRRAADGFFYISNQETEESLPMQINDLGVPHNIDFKYVDNEINGVRIEDLASWKSENPGIAAVDEKTGRIRGVSAGKTTITITSFTGNLVEKFDVYVSPLVKSTGTPANQYKKELNINVTQGNSASFDFDSGDSKNIEWRVARNSNISDVGGDYIPVGGPLSSKNITLSPSYNPSTSSGSMNITAKAGDYYIYMYIKGGAGTSIPYALVHLKIIPNLPENDMIIMNVNDTYNLLDSFNILPPDFDSFFSEWSAVTSDVDINGDTIIYNNNSVSLDKYVIKGRMLGTAKFKFKHVSGKWHYITIKVIDAISLNTTLANIYIGQTIRLQCTTTNNASISWKSSKPEIATVDNDGNVTGVSSSSSGGSTIITATQTINGVVKQASCTIYVSESITGININPAELILEVGKKSTIKATFIPVDLTGNLNIKWVSSDYSMVDIIETTGKSATIEAKKGGTVVISAINLDNAVVGTCKVIVQQPMTGIKLSQATLSVNMPKKNSGNESFQLQATYTPTHATATEIIWQSTNTTVATVNEKTGLVTPKAPGSTVIIAKPVYNPNNISAMCNFTVNQTTTGISLDTTAKTMEAGDKYRVTYSVLPATATNKVVSWTSMDNKIASVADGLITAQSAGQTYIVATTQDGYTATCTITVTQAAAKIKLSTNDLTMRAGDIYYVDATVTPATSTETKFTWTSQEPSIATVDGKGKVTGVAAGKTIIMVKTKKGDLEYLYVTVQESLTGLALNTKEKTIAINKSFTLTPEFKPAEPTNKKVTWSSSNPKIAAVTDKGLVKGIAGGTAMISCISEDGGFVAVCSVTVKEPVTSLTLSPSSHKLGIGKSVTLKATVKTNTSSNQTLKWTSSNTKIATVSSKGKVIAKKRGTCTITCTTTDGSETSAESVIRVVQQVTSIKLNKTSVNLLEGASSQLSISVKPSNATYKTVNWTSSDETIATVDSNGRIVALKAGNCKIYAKAKDNSAQQAVCWVYVTTLVPATGITVSQKDMVMVKGASDFVAVSVQPNTATDKIRYASDNTTVVSVTSQGKVTARKSGAATITVTTSSGKMAMVNVTVVGINTTTLRMTQYTTDELWIEEVTTNVKWRSLNSEIATVSNGIITARKPGRTQIEATVKGRKLYCTVDVIPVK